jgi:hypothetical protein
MVADVFEQWIKEADIDGFNMACELLPITFNLFLMLVRCFKPRQL